MTKFKLFYGYIFCCSKTLLKASYLKKIIGSAKYSPVADSTLHTAHYTVHTTPAHEHTHLLAPLHFILHTEHYTLDTTHLYCLLHMYHFTLQTFKICLSGTQYLHGKIYINILSLVSIRHFSPSIVFLLSTYK